LVAKVHTAVTQSGRLSKGVAVTTDAVGAERLNLMMTFTVQQVIEVRPQPRVTLQSIKGQGASQRLVLHRADGKPLEVTRFELDSANQVGVKLEPVTAPGEQGSQPGDVVVEVSTAADSPEGNRGGRLSLFTNHPEQPEVVVSLQVRVRPLIEPRPERVQLWVDEGTAAGRTTSFRLTSNHEQPFTVTGIVSSHPELFTAAPVTTDARLLQTVQVTLAENADLASMPAAVNGTLRVSSDDPAQPVVEVPVVISKRIRTTRPARVIRPAPPADGVPAEPPAADAEKG
jgi:hypothetical protein